jgi:hypothetical protein
MNSVCNANFVQIMVESYDHANSRHEPNTCCGSKTADQALTNTQNSACAQETDTHHNARCHTSRIDIKGEISRKIGIHRCQSTYSGHHNEQGRGQTYKRMGAHARGTTVLAAF